ncbi:MAG: thioesterase family protein [Betaproteobacteria bacterium]|jgi:acyl-CoA thioester hydrolase|nr:thioesterase family protein [Betaproteobacteria bacterium]
MSGASEIPVPFAEARAVVRPEWIDYNGHMNVGYFSVVFDVAADAFLEFLGFTQAFRSQYGSTTFALEQHLNFLREVNEGDTLRFEARLLDFDAKRFHFYQEMFRVGDHRPAASCEGLSAHVSTATRRTAPMPQALLERLAAIKQAHAALARPWQIGHVLSVRPPARG